MSGILLVATLFFVIETTYFFATSREAKGYVIDTIQKEDNGDMFYYPVYEYFLPDGTKMKATSSFGTGKNYAIGDTILIRYSKGSPEDARVNHFFNFWALPSVLLIVSLFFGTLGVINRKWIGCFEKQ